MHSALLVAADATQSAIEMLVEASVAVRTTLRILFGPKFVRALGVASALGYVAFLTTGWVLNSPVGFDGVLRPAPHEIEAGGPPFTVLEIEPGSPAERAGLRAGDAIAAVDGNPLVFDVHQTYHNRRAGSIGTLRVVAPDGPQAALSFTLESRLASPSVVVGLLIAALLGLALMAVGACVAVIRPAHPAAKLLLAFELGLAIYATSDLWHWTQSAGAAANIVDQLTLSAMLVGGAALVHLFLIFPAPGGAYTSARRALPVLYALPAILLGLSLVGLYGLAWPLSQIALAGILVASLALLERSYRRPATPLARAQMGWIRWGLSVGVAATVVSVLASLIVKDAVPAATGTVVAAIWLLFPITLAFAVLRYRLFEVDRVIRATLTWGILAAVLLACYFGLVITLGRLVAGWLVPSAATDPTAAVVAVLGVAAVAHPLRSRLQSALNQHVYRDRFARAQVLAEAGRFLGESQSPLDVARFLSQVVPQALRLSGSWLSLPDSRAGLVEVEPGVLAPNVSLASPALLDALQCFDEPTFIARPEDLDAYAGMSAVSAAAPGVSAWYAAGARVLVPMRSPTDSLPLAVWALGAPTSGDLLDRDDLETLARVAGMAAMQLDRAFLRLRLRLGPGPGPGPGLDLDSDSDLDSARHFANHLSVRLQT